MDRPNRGIWNHQWGQTPPLAVSHRYGRSRCLIMCNNDKGKTSTNVPLSIAMLVHYGLLASRSQKKNFRLVQLAGCEGLPWPWPGPHEGGACFQLARQQLPIHSEKITIVIVIIKDRQMDYEWFWYIYTSSTAQGGGGSFKNRKPIGEVGCCESGMAERIHWWTERCLRSPLFCSLSLTIYLPT